MDCSERPLADAVLANLRGCADQARAMLGQVATTPAAVVAAVDAVVAEAQRGTSVVDPADVPYLFGSLWGDQVVAAFGWAWAEVVFRRHEGTVALAVVSPDRSMAIFPVHFIAGCLADPDADVTIALSFGQLDADAVGGFTPGGYANVMDHVYRVAP
jgi:hypothetical protein